MGQEVRKRGRKIADSSLGIDADKMHYLLAGYWISTLEECLDDARVVAKWHADS